MGSPSLESPPLLYAIMWVVEMVITFTSGMIYAFFFIVPSLFYYNLFTIIDIHSLCRGLVAETAATHVVPISPMSPIGPIGLIYAGDIVAEVKHELACAAYDVLRKLEVGAAGAEGALLAGVLQRVVGGHVVDVVVGGGVDGEGVVVADELHVGVGLRDGSVSGRTADHGDTGKHRLHDVVGAVAVPLDNVGHPSLQCGHGRFAEGQCDVRTGHRSVNECLGHGSVERTVLIVKVNLERQAEGVPGAVLVEGAAGEGYGEGLACVVGDGGGVVGGVGQGEAGLEGGLSG